MGDAIKVSTYGIGDVDFTAHMDSTDKQRIGYHAVSLTDFEGTDEPLIAAGSKLEVGGALYEWTDDGDIYDEDSNGFTDGDVWIKCIPTGDTLDIVFTNTAPTWSDSKQGLYGTGDSAGHRYLQFKIDFVSPAYTKNILLVDRITGAYVSADGVTITYDSDVVFNGAASFGDDSVFGYLSDGTVLFAKLLTVSVSSTTGTAAHGISNAYTNNRILMANPVTSSPGSTAPWGMLSPGKMNLNSDDMSAAFTRGGVRAVSWDDTNLRISQYYTSGAAQSYIVLIIYTE